MLARGDHGGHRQLPVTLAPVRHGARPLVVRNLERTEDVDPAALAEVIAWDWQTFPEYLAAVDARPNAINDAAQGGHSALRTWAIGERAFEEEATEDDLVAMERQLAEALKAGAIGFSTSRRRTPRDLGQWPVASRLASWDEVRRLVQVLSDAGTGAFEGGSEACSRTPKSGPGPRPRCSTWSWRRASVVTSGLIATNPGAT